MENKTLFRSFNKLSALANNSFQTLSDNDFSTHYFKYSIFYKLYQIDTSSSDDGTEKGQKEKSESSRSKGLNSLWGSIWSICTNTGWSMHYVLWRVAWINIEMMISDAPSYSSATEDKETKTAETEDELKEFLKL